LPADGVIVNEWTGSLGGRTHATGIEVWRFDDRGLVCEHRLYSYLDARPAASPLQRLRLLPYGRPHGPDVSRLAADQTELLGVLARHGVEFVVVGGVAAQVHGWQGATADLDIAVSAEDANVERLNLALAGVGAGSGTIGAFGSFFATRTGDPYRRPISGPLSPGVVGPGRS
jgi:hypothetical protein